MSSDCPDTSDIIESLSTREDAAVAREADDLCRFIEPRHDELAKASLGKRMDFGGKECRLFFAGRNTIYRIHGDFDWYLKLPRNGDESVIRHEIAGTRSVRATLENAPGYQHPLAIRGSISGRYILCSEVQGRRIGRVLNRSCLFRFNGLGSETTDMFRNFGRALGAFHGYEDGDPNLVTNRDTLRYLINDLKRVERRSDVYEEIAAWAHQQSDSGELQTWIHGNIKCKNVLVQGGQFTILDFENCGTGSPHEDLSGLCCHMILPRALPIYPWRRARTAMTAMMAGYREQRSYDRDQLLNHIARKVCRHYVTNVLLRKGPATAAGIPVLQHRLDHLTRLWIRGEYDEALVGIEI